MDRSDATAPAVRPKYVFGPVASRRLGRSLGIDVVPFKVCTYDCIYCQLGPTSVHTVERKDYVPLQDVLDQVKIALSDKGHLDYVTLSGSGEPTLYLHLAELINGIKARTDVPVAVITNGSLLWDPKVRDALCLADLVVPTFDVSDQAGFEQVHRPHSKISYRWMLQGLVDFCREYRGTLWLEVFVVGGMNDTPEKIAPVAELVRGMRVDKVHLNTVIRPAHEAHAKAASRERMAELAKLFGDLGEVVADFRDTGPHSQKSATDDDVVELLKRHPCSVEDVAMGMGIAAEQAQEILARLVARGLVRKVQGSLRQCYAPTA